MERFTVFPDKALTDSGPVSREFLGLGVRTLIEACRFVHELPYGYNSDRDDLMVLFKERFGSCTTKHAVIATLAEEIGLPIRKAVGIYGMNEDIVAGAKDILDRYGLPCLPMLHCFLVHDDHRVDLTEGNRNGKKRSIEDFLHTEQVIPNISAKDEYLLYRKALADSILHREEFKGIEIKQVLHAREMGLALLKDKIERK